MKSTFIVTLTFLSLILYGQKNMNERLSRLFLDLDLTASPKSMASKSSLKFEYGTNQTISWGNANNNIGNYVANFNKNPLIESKIKEGIITIIAGDPNVENNTFSINERIWFYNYDDMLNEYNKICSSFETLGYRVKTTIVQNDNFETKSQNTEILMEADSKKTSLTIGYYLPPTDEKNKDFFLSLIYNNH